MSESAAEINSLKMAELNKLNLPKFWREILQIAGPDMFIKIWRVASCPENQWKQDKIYVPSIKKYQEFQCVQIIKCFIESNMSCTEITKELEKHGMSRSPDTIRRIARKYDLGEVPLR